MSQKGYWFSALDDLLKMDELMMICTRCLKDFPIKQVLLEYILKRKQTMYLKNQVCVNL
ncbi:unnamed protein product (macronuclear) [Paramecium tetraurelia]|uniref:Uncharacterized protein n=1 Tax=Paramecium tetraurelia TaxID=5888 RepID=A0DMM8_PARTE|nr:uncharacterized protein GSPATT00039677001 [Paramecium tetraurelia]CAK84295.1 unnamed protein product [Paramecium tetraurelia]|eukprot:XP_001451692.1 hypothetical protein (macronuclear) [Paramecium tetraurelia strain d4-2]